MTLDLTRAEPIPDAARDEVERLLATGDLFRYTSDDAPAAQLERAFADLLGARYALAVSSCSAALFLTLTAAGLPAGARVLLPAFTFAAVPSAVLHAGMTPVLVECGADLRLDIDDLRAKSDGADAILISHMRGHTSDMDAIMSVSEAAGLSVIEDAAHSLGTTWDGRPIGTIGHAGCFSFQSYKLLNAGEGGMIVSDDAELMARAAILSGAYERNWKKHDEGLHEAAARWQNRLPLYNMRLGNLSAALVQAQLPEVARRVRDGRRNHDHVAARLEGDWFSVPRPLQKESRAPDSIQFTLHGVSDTAACAFAEEAGVQIFGLSEGNARAFWNWEFLQTCPDMPRTRAVLMRTCDLRLPARLTPAECDRLADQVLDAAAATLARPRAYGT